MTIFRIGLLALALLSGMPSSVEARPISVDDVLALERLDRITVSPDRRLLAAVVLRGALAGEVYGRAAYEIDPSRGDIWIVDRQTGAQRNLTQGRAQAAGSWCAIWSPDAQRLAFLSTRPEGTEPHGGNNVRLYIWERGTNQIRRLGQRALVTQTRYGGAISKLDLAGPGLRTPEACTANQENAPFTWLDSNRLLVAALLPGRTSAMMDASERIYRHTSFTHEALRAGREAIVSASGSGAERTGMSSDEAAMLAVIDADTGERTDIARVPAYPFHGSLGVRVSADGRRIAVLATVAAIAPDADIPSPKNDGEWLVEKRLGFIDLVKDRKIRWTHLPPAARLPVALESWNDVGRAVSFSARSEPQEGKAHRFSADFHTGDVIQLAAGRELPVQSPPTGLPEAAELVADDPAGLVWTERTPQGTFVRAGRRGDGRTRQLLALNRHLANVDLGKTFTIDYKGEGGEPLKGAVLLPPGYRRGDRLPLIVWVYGGYSVRGADDYFFDPYMPGIYNLRLYAARGYAVLVPSIPLSRGAAQDHLTALAPAVLPAVMRLASMGIADPERVGVMGQSYGGYTALGLATQTDRFRAVVAIASLSDLTAFYGEFDPLARGYGSIEHEKSGNGLIAEVGAVGRKVPPHSDPEGYHRNSPLTFVGRVTAPVLLIHGEHDIRGSMYQSEGFFTGLRRQGKTARILRYWGEDHALAASPATARSVVDEVIRWFDRYLRISAPKPPS